MTTEINNEVFYTPVEFAKLMRYADARPVWRYIKSGDIPTVARMDRKYLIPKWYVDRVVKGGNSAKR